MVSQLNKLKKRNYHGNAYPTSESGFNPLQWKALSFFPASLHTGNFGIDGIGCYPAITDAGWKIVLWVLELQKIIFHLRSGKPNR